MGQTVQPRVSVQGNKASNLLLKTPVGVESAVGETPRLTGELIGEINRVPECTQAHPLGSSTRRAICLWVVVQVTENWLRAEQAALFPLGPLPHIQHHNIVTWVALPW